MDYFIPIYHFLRFPPIPREITHLSRPRFIAPSQQPNRFQPVPAPPLQAHTPVVAVPRPEGQHAMTLTLPKPQKSNACSSSSTPSKHFLRVVEAKIKSIIQVVSLA